MNYKLSKTGRPITGGSKWERKTNRVYGQNMQLILVAANLLGQITWETFEDVMTKDSAISMLNTLRRKGHLRTVKSGVRGRCGVATVYEPNPESVKFKFI